MSNLRVAMIAPPWLEIPPKGYGGIEHVLAVLVPELVKQGVEVELFTIKGSTVQASKIHYLYKTEQMPLIHSPWYDAAPIVIAHLQHALNTIRKDGGFDIIHDHNNFLGPLALVDSNNGLPPAIHTTHNPRFSTPDVKGYSDPILDNRLMWKKFSEAQKLHFVGLSKYLTKSAPREMKSRLLKPVHNAVDLDEFPLVKKKHKHFITLARFHPEKGQSIATRACKELGYPLKMAGNVAGIGTSKKLMLELANPLSKFRGVTDFRYFSDHIFPHLEKNRIEFVGEVKSQRRINFISKARALLFPIRWHEPFGMAVIEAMACGTPVIAMNKGAMPELIDHGVSGFLANNEREFKEYMQRVDEIDPEQCRQKVIDHFSGPVMAQNYIKRYREVIDKRI